MVSSIPIALSGLDAATKRLSASASNIANLQTAGSLEPEQQAPYTPLTTQQSANGTGGVRAEIVPRQNPFVPAYDPDSPFADASGLIGLPNVDLAEEAVNLNIAELTYKANIKTLQAASDLDKELLRLFDKEA